MPAMPPFRFPEAIDRDSGRINVIIDTPRGSRGKYKYDEKTGLYRLGKLLPLGMHFPFNFGFIPGTAGQDGDALDLLMLGDEPAILGCVAQVRLIGVLEAMQKESNGKTVRNDRLIGALETEYNAPPVRSLDTLGEQMLAEIEHFFISYNEMEGRHFQPVDRSGPERAQALLMDGIRQAQTKKRAS